ncbi:BMC domain-containing protein [Clostridium sp. E02]|uniref:BMC domain-containing protein n=1 Tax=Clostridium sp. E02 TaxID=2487134 RepID=UPI000F53D0C9|nr:BMC domain-containing protein [Clostridium sp. E02]
MQALGMIETKGVLAAIEASDVMLKAANVSLIEKTKVGGGLIFILVTGDVAAVSAAVEAGVAAVNRISQDALFSSHVIPRPHKELEGMIGESVPQTEESKNNTDKASEQVQELAFQPHKLEELNLELESESGPYDRETVDTKMRQNGFHEMLKWLEDRKVTELRTLAREYPEFSISGREISKANKTLLLEEFKTYYGKNDSEC